MEKLPSNLAVKHQYRLWILKAIYFLELAGYKPEDFIPGNSITIKGNGDIHGNLISAHNYVLDAIEERRNKRNSKIPEREQVYVLPPDALWLEENLIPLEKILSKMLDKYQPDKSTIFEYKADCKK